MKVLVVNGPNLNLLGLREPDLYGSRTYAELEEFIRRSAAELSPRVAGGLVVEIVQTNHEGAIVDWIQRARTEFDALILNAAAYTHTSVAILDALKATRLKTVEVHLTDPDLREDFRRVNFVRPAAAATFKGLGFGSYAAALEHLVGARV